MLREDVLSLFNQKLSQVLRNKVVDLKPLSSHQLGYLLYKLGKMKRAVIIDAPLARLIVQSLVKHRLSGKGLSRAMQLLVSLPYSSSEARMMIVKALADSLNFLRIFEQF